MALEAQEARKGKAEMKRSFGTLTSKTGNVVEVRNKTVAAALEAAAADLKRAREDSSRCHDQLGAMNLRLATLQNHWWVRLGEALGVLRIGGAA